MTAPPPSIFDTDGFARMRTVSKAYRFKQNFQQLIEQLSDTCITNEYLGISPQNLITPAELLRVILVREHGVLKTFINPRIKSADGARECYEACANIRLQKDGEPFIPAVKTIRPTHMKISFVDDDGECVTRSLYETCHRNYRESTPLTVVCHEIDHLHGRLITDIARDRLIHELKIVPNTKDEETRGKSFYNMPFVLHFDGSQYVVCHGLEFVNQDIPEVSPDCIFLDLLFAKREGLKPLRVVRDGEVFEIKPSEMIQKIYDL